MQINVLQQLGSRAQTALKENIAALQAAGQFDQVDAVVKGAPDYAISQAGRDAILADNENLRVTTGVQNAILAGNKADALKLYKAAMKLPSLSPMAKAKLANAIKGVQASVSTNVRKEKDPATGKEKTVIVPPELPADAPLTSSPSTSKTMKAYRQACPSSRRRTSYPAWCETPSPCKRTNRARKTNGLP